MRKAFVALLLLAGTAAFMVNNAAARELSGDDGINGERLATHGFKNELSRAARLGTSTTPGASDTIFIGYSPGNFNATNNYWSVRAHPGRDANNKSNANTGGQGGQEKGQWGFEAKESAWASDSLQGWTAWRLAYGSTGGQTRKDWARPWWAINIGNNVNQAPGGHEGRTHGVVGVWHRDDSGLPVGALLKQCEPTCLPVADDHDASNHVFGGAGGDASGADPAWAVLDGTYSAWMGLRAHNDVRFVDAITGNPFTNLGNSFHIEGPSVEGDGSDASFPGYSSQMDQMLYRDIDMSLHTTSDLKINFRYSTEMSTGFGTADGTRTGWFHHDPLQVTFTSTAGPQAPASLGNFISSSDAGNANAPRDSFMVYVGAPTGATFKASNGATLVTDPLRKWFSETIQSVDGHYEQILSTTGSQTGITNPEYTVDGGLGTRLAQILANGNNKVRLVFRVQTNRGFDDEGTAYNSFKKGAVQIDNVSYQIVGGPASPAGWGTFEDGADPIDNTQDALDAWRSTGKPPWATGHVENISIFNTPGRYDDLCGAIGSATRICDLNGNILTFGDHDNGHAHGRIVDFTADREVVQNATSPTILFATPASGTNAIGLNTAGADATEDYYVSFHLYGGVFNPAVKGDYWRYNFQSYPAGDDYGNPTWGYKNPPPYIIFNPDPQCFVDFIDHPVNQLGLLETSNASGIPDSVRISVSLWQRCFRTPATQCGSTAGAYYDNISLMAVDGSPKQLGVDLWDFFNDTFPSNESVTPGVKASFDTAAAVVKIGRAIGPDYVTGKRYATPGDSVTIHSSSDQTEVYMVFRILPGAGNYVTNGRPDLDGQFNLRQVPTSATPIVSGSLTNFWSNYIANPGLHGSAVGHPGSTPRLGVHGAWDPNVWNSARCDTAEANLFALRALGATGGPPVSTDYMSMYHELDPKGGAKGSGGSPAPLARAINVCYIARPIGPTDQVLCTSGDVSGISYPPPWTFANIGIPTAPDPFTGYPGTTKTFEFTKIIPDGILTPGAHVQYFFARYELGDGSAAIPVAMVPDTMTVFPQNGESSTDAHRWQQFGVLPDAWKDGAHKHPLTNQFGLGMACMLVVDNNDRRGNERVWVSIADSIGATSALKRGAHNGWSAVGGADVNDAAGFVAAHGGQPGTTWDLYGVKASESLGTGSGHIGGRVGVRETTGNPQVFGNVTGQPAGQDPTFLGKLSRQGPTPAMLKEYGTIFYMSGDLNSDVLSPYGQRTANDIALIQDFLSTGNVDPMSVDRAFYGVGDGLVEDTVLHGGIHSNLMFAYFGVNLLNASYATLTGNNEATPDLTTVNGVIEASSHVYGIRNVCLWTNDVLTQMGVAVPTTIAAEYEGPSGAYVSGLVHAHSASEPYISMIDGWDIEHLTSTGDVSTGARLDYYFKVLGNVFADIANCTIVGTPIGPLDVTSRNFGNYVRLASSNPMRGEARIELSLAKADRVEVKVFDVSGRLVRTLADRMFEAGPATLVWDGADNDGRPVSRGVYFTQVKYKNSAFNAAKKLTVLQ